MLGELPPAEVRIPAVTTTDAVAVGDLVVVVDLGGSSGPAYDALGVLTAKEVMTGSANVAKVVSTAAKSLTLVMIPTPKDGWECDLEGFAERSFDPTEIRLTLNAKSRQIGRLGTASEVRAKIADHPEFSAWAQAYQEAKAIDREAQEAADYRAELAKRRQQTLCSLADLLTDAVGGRVFVEDDWGRISTAQRFYFFHQEDTLRIYLAGLHAVGRLDDELYAKVQDGLYDVELLRDETQDDDLD
ncbi:hypothetical protein [Streptomyces sp. NPDC058268]|uniref:hypothetical protein n=1 Tax=Streptomyces sp. NPDC058268 TaxID=3346413 RepID=UPI0036DFBD35